LARITTPSLASNKLPVISRAIDGAIPPKAACKAWFENDRDKQLSLV